MVLIYFFKYWGQQKKTKNYFPQISLHLKNAQKGVIYYYYPFQSTTNVIQFSYSISY